MNAFKVEQAAADELLKSDAMAELQRGLKALDVRSC
jgi:hypothetical protein